MKLSELETKHISIKSKQVYNIYLQLFIKDNTICLLGVEWGKTELLQNHTAFFYNEPFAQTVSKSAGRKFSRGAQLIFFINFGGQIKNFGRFGPFVWSK